MKASPFQQYIHRGLTLPLRLPSPLLTISLLIVGCLAFTIAGFWLFFVAEAFRERMMAIICIVFFCMGIPSLLPFLTKADIAIFDRAGLFTRRYGLKIYWADIRAVGIVEAKGHESLCVAVETYDKYRTRLSPTAIFIRWFYRTLPGQVGAVALIAALKPSESIKMLKLLKNIENFDFFWSAHEFPYISLREVKNIIEIESRKARKLSY